jgi:shikimate dehydrogenase
MLDAHPLIINTTILGTNGVGLPALPYGALTHGHLLFDLVYNPALTPFLEQGMAKGAAIKNGLQMLQLQAEAAWGIWQHDLA